MECALSTRSLPRFRNVLPRLIMTMTVMEISKRFFFPFGISTRFFFFLLMSTGGNSTATVGNDYNGRAPRA